MKLTYHARVERLDRIVDILSTVGLGEPIARRINPNNKRINEPSFEVLTSSGIILIISEKDELITAYATSFIHMKTLYTETHPHMQGGIPKFLRQAYQTNLKLGLIKNN